MEKTVYDITEICAMFKTTSRTLRFYEQKGLISSIRANDSSRRQYAKTQLEQIRNVLVLRKLGLSIKKIEELQKQDTDLKTALLEKRAEIGALIDTNLKKITLLNQALALSDEDKNVLAQDFDSLPAHNRPEIEKIIRECNESIICGIPEPLYKHLSDTMKLYMPPSVFREIRADTLKPLGNFCEIERLENDKTNTDIFYQFIRYEKLGLKIRYVFIEEKIHGLWLGYYEL